MIKFSELKQGSHVMAAYDGDVKRGEIAEIKKSEKQVCINLGEQTFWFDTGKGLLTAIPITDAELTNFKFTKLVNTDGSVKYSKGAFRLLIPQQNDFSRIEMWYRDETRNFAAPMALHTLQTHFFEMTKVFLNDGSFD